MTVTLSFLHVDASHCRAPRTPVPEPPSTPLLPREQGLLQRFVFVVILLGESNTQGRLPRETGNRQSALPGHRTGAPGVHINKRPGYQLLESKVRVFVAPPIQDILACPVRFVLYVSCVYSHFCGQLKPYVASAAHVPRKEANGIFRGMPGPGLTPEHFLASARRYTDQQLEKKKAEKNQETLPAAAADARSAVASAS